MFFLNIPRWKIKRFIKGIIRSILFFVVLSSFITICNADSLSGSFDSWADLVDDSKTTVTVDFSDGYVASGLFSVLWSWLPWQITSIIKFLLLFGIFGFVLNIVSYFRRT